MQQRTIPSTLLIIIVLSIIGFHYKDVQGRSIVMIVDNSEAMTSSYHDPDRRILRCVQYFIKNYLEPNDQFGLITYDRTARAIIGEDHLVAAKEIKETPDMMNAVVEHIRYNGRDSDPYLAIEKAANLLGMGSSLDKDYIIVITASYAHPPRGIYRNQKDYRNRFETLIKNKLKNTFITFVTFEDVDLNHDKSWFPLRKIIRIDQGLGDIILMNPRNYQITGDYDRSIFAMLPKIRWIIDCKDRRGNSDIIIAAPESQQEEIFNRLRDEYGYSHMDIIPLYFCNESASFSDWGTYTSGNLITRIKDFYHREHINDLNVYVLELWPFFSGGQASNSWLRCLKIRDGIIGDSEVIKQIDDSNYSRVIEQFAESIWGYASTVNNMPPPQQEVIKVKVVYSDLHDYNGTGEVISLELDRKIAESNAIFGQLEFKIPAGKPFELHLPDTVYNMEVVRDRMISGSPIYYNRPSMYIYFDYKGLKDITFSVSVIIDGESLGTFTVVDFPSDTVYIEGQMHRYYKRYELGSLRPRIQLQRLDQFGNHDPTYDERLIDDMVPKDNTLVIKLENYPFQKNILEPVKNFVYYSGRDFGSYVSAYKLFDQEGKRDNRNDCFILGSMIARAMEEYGDTHPAERAAAYACAFDIWTWLLEDTDARIRNVTMSVYKKVNLTKDDAILFATLRAGILSFKLKFWQCLPRSEETYSVPGDRKSIEKLWKKFGKFEENFPSQIQFTQKIQKKYTKELEKLKTQLDKLYQEVNREADLIPLRMRIIKFDERQGVALPDRYMFDQLLVNIGDRDPNERSAERFLISRETSRGFRHPSLEVMNQFVNVYQSIIPTLYYGENRLDEHPKTSTIAELNNQAMQITSNTKQPLEFCQPENNLDEMITAIQGWYILTEKEKKSIGKFEKKLTKLKNKIVAADLSEEKSRNNFRSKLEKLAEEYLKTLVARMHRKVELIRLQHELEQLLEKIG
ncbi:hypothetical protein CEE37_14450 [candidate division LCP-89 bacterium B3_LCP]|uniref:VWFA domain-containing protein n=1 Tax=candidate division LCP-89 bacterium B3_LCP TaxID=2012998 RepID=A0A532UPT9_UNCL8|nr:MAG: hypothetical protein CEE37_14450 [candidate division LCP-89 bacterium B3_LCP]